MLTQVHDMVCAVEQFVFGNWLQPLAWNPSIRKDMVEFFYGQMTPKYVMDRDDDLPVRSETPGIPLKCKRKSLCTAAGGIRGAYRRISHGAC